MMATFQFDSAIKINYPGSSNNSKFTSDGLDRIIQIVETSSGTPTSTKQFVWDRETMQEARNGTGGVTAQYFAFGCVNGGTNFFYTKDKLESICELTNSTGSVQTEYSYDAYGNAVKIQGSFSSDFQYAGYYFHSPSGLNMATYRSYSSKLGRWLSRDPVYEKGGVNLYGYVQNNPLVWNDPTGLYCTCHDTTCCEKNKRECDARGGDAACCLGAYLGCLNRVPPLTQGGQDGTAGFANCTRSSRKSPFVGGQPGSGTANGPFVNWIVVGVRPMKHVVAEEMSI